SLANYVCTLPLIYTHASCSLPNLHSNLSQSPILRPPSFAFNSMPPAALHLKRTHSIAILAAPLESRNAMPPSATDRSSMPPSFIDSAELLPCSKILRLMCSSDTLSADVAAPPVDEANADPHEADKIITNSANYQSDLQAKRLPDSLNDLETFCTERVADNSDVATRIDMSAGLDEQLIREMMHNLEQAIGGNAQFVEDSSSCSSSPTSNTTSCARWIDIDGEQMAESSAHDVECFDIFADSSASIDEEVQRLLQQGDDQALLDFYPYFYPIFTKG
ncbi:hypothetical protein GOP47_0005643, partial [Adiantum capillus-veneris]